MKALKISQIEEIAYQLAKRQMDWDEPIPEFGTRYPGKLEATLGQAFQTYGKRDLYPGLLDKASILFYLMIKNHPFINGNKRIAVTTTITFLLLNKNWLQVENEMLYEIAVWVAKSNPHDKDAALAIIKGFLKRNLIEIR